MPRFCSECKKREPRHAPGCEMAGCEYCHAQAGHKPDCPDYDGPKSVEPGFYFDVHDASKILEVSAVKNGVVMYRTPASPELLECNELDFASSVSRKLTDDEAKVHGAGMMAGKIVTIVNGTEAEIVLDGTTGRAKGDEGEQLALIKGDPDEILTRLRSKREDFVAESYELQAREEAHKEQKKLVDLIQKQLNAIVAELCDATKAPSSSESGELAAEETGAP